MPNGRGGCTNRIQAKSVAVQRCLTVRRVVLGENRVVPCVAVYPPPADQGAKAFAVTATTKTAQYLPPNLRCVSKMQR